jgi:phage regulator Rha-like protein
MPGKLSLADRLPVPVELIERRIYVIRNQKVMMDSDLADLYRVETRVLVQAIKRNGDRFPGDFMFQLSAEETDVMRSQSVIASKRNVRYLPYAFTEHGVAMLSSVLNSKRAVQMNILIIRAFVKLRELLATNKALAARIEKLEAGQRDHAIAIRLVAKDVQNLAQKLRRPRQKKARIGFVTDGN